MCGDNQLTCFCPKLDPNWSRYFVPSVLETWQSARSMLTISWLSSRTMSHDIAPFGLSRNAVANLATGTRSQNTREAILIRTFLSCLFLGRFFVSLKVCRRPNDMFSNVKQPQGARGVDVLIWLSIKLEDYWGNIMIYCHANYAFVRFNEISNTNFAMNTRTTVEYNFTQAYWAWLFFHVSKKNYSHCIRTRCISILDYEMKK